MPLEVFTTNLSSAKNSNIGALRPCFREENITSFEEFLLEDKANLQESELIDQPFTEIPPKTALYCFNSTELGLENKTKDDEAQDETQDEVQTEENLQTLPTNLPITLPKAIIESSKESDLSTLPLESNIPAKLSTIQEVNQTTPSPSDDHALLINPDLDNYINQSSTRQSGHQKPDHLREAFLSKALGTITNPNSTSNNQLNQESSQKSLAFSQENADSIISESLETIKIPDVKIVNHDTNNSKDTNYTNNSKNNTHIDGNIGFQKSLAPRDLLAQNLLVQDVNYVVESNRTNSDITATTLPITTLPNTDNLGTEFDIADFVIIDNSQQKPIISFKDSNQTSLSKAFGDVNLSLQNQVALVMKYATSHDKNEVRINLHPKSLGSIDIKIEFIINNFGEREVEKITIIPEYLSTLKILEDTKIHLENSFIEQKKSVTTVIAEATKKEDSLDLDMRDGNSRDHSQASFGDFESFEERENWLNRFKGIIKIDLEELAQSQSIADSFPQDKIYEYNSLHFINMEV